ncbi:MAG: hypothetical protein LAT50_22155, partial [Ectothiorhodospiraceae bacterium]|nr:hypothetical protein [Ectothiorhodospiraceae bacterium]
LAAAASRTDKFLRFLSPLTEVVAVSFVPFAHFPALSSRCSFWLIGWLYMTTARTCHSYALLMPPLMDGRVLSTFQLFASWDAKNVRTHHVSSCKGT